MKHFCLLSLLLLSSFLVKSQIYFPSGAIWHYGLPSFNSASFSYTTIESKGDSIFNGDTLTYLEGSVACSVGNNELVKQQGQKVYKLNECDSTFSLLYDFGALQGDTIIIQTDPCSNQNDTVFLFIDSTSTISINGVTLNQSFTTQLNPASGYTFSGKIIEGIGNVTSFYPLVGFCDPNGGPLRCYNDHLLGLYKNGSTSPCDTNYSVGIEKKDINNEIKIYPNPSKTKFQIITNTQIKSIDLFNIDGRKILTTKNNEIDIEKLSKGIYILKVHLQNGTQIRKIIKE
ncbi:MAG: T9SS type A sorting domain-containing protein [Vicingaceae bacterium]|nr:T9SS type A sorting domain-containing protein [Vicingaceae bacterium]